MLKRIAAALALAAAVGGMGTAHAALVEGECDGGGNGTCCYPIDTPVGRQTPCLDGSKIELHKP